MSEERGRQFATADEAITWLAGEPAKRMQAQIDRLKSEVAWRIKWRHNEKNYERKARKAYAENIRAVVEQRNAMRAAFVKLAIPTTAFLMDVPSHKYVAPEIVLEWQDALREGEKALGGVR